MLNDGSVFWIEKVLGLIIKKESPPSIIVTKKPNGLKNYG